MAIENTDTNGVELYKWVQEANENGEMVLKRVYEETTSQEFTQQHRTNYTFVGYTIESKQLESRMHMYSVKGIEESGLWDTGMASSLPADPPRPQLLTGEC